MKKNIFMIMMLSLVFLGLGNVSFADVDCGDGTMCPGITDCDCVEEYYTNGQPYTPQKLTCDACKNTPAPNNVIDGNTEEDIVLAVSCENVPTSSLNNDPHAIISIPGASCTCAKGYGEYYNTTGPKAGKTTCELCTRNDVCCGTKLNTKIPFIGNCIESSTQASGSTINETTAFPILVSSLVKILISVILITSFILIVAAGVMWTTGDAKGGKDMIIKVAIGLAILGASGVILRLINPNFFG